VGVGYSCLPVRWEGCDRGLRACQEGDVRRSAAVQRRVGGSGRDFECDGLSDVKALDGSLENQVGILDDVSGDSAGVDESVR